MSWTPKTEFAITLAEAMVAQQPELDRNQLSAVIGLVLHSGSGWKVERTITPNSGQHPLERIHHGAYITLTTPWRPEDADERYEREQRKNVFMWRAYGANGQHELSSPPPEGVTTLDLLGQNVWWVTSKYRGGTAAAARWSQGVGDDFIREETPKLSWEERVIRITDMRPSHARNTAALLHRNAVRLHLGEALEAISGPGPSGDAANDMFRG